MRKISSIAHLLNIFVEEANIVFKPCKTREIPAPLQYPSNLEKLGVGFAESKKNKKPIKLAPVEWENFTKSLLLLSQSFAEFREFPGRVGRTTQESSCCPFTKGENSQEKQKG